MMRMGMQGGGENPSTSKKTSKKVQGLFDKSLISKVLGPTGKKKALQHKVKVLHQASSLLTKEGLSKEQTTLEDVVSLDQIPLVPTLELSAEQLENFIPTITELHQHYNQFGAVKFRLPAGYPVQGLDLSNSKKALTIRQQVLPHLSKGKVHKQVT